MAEIKETDARFLLLRGKVILFAGIALAGIITLLFLIAKQKGLFQKTEEVYFVAERATGLYTGMPVKVSGFKIGRLKDMKLQDDATVRITLSIEASQMKWLREDSYAFLTKEGLIGESIIEIIPGRGRNLMQGERINFERLKGIEEMAGELKGEITVILNEIKELLTYINAPQGDVKKSLSNLQKISEELIETTRATNKLLEELNVRLTSIGDKTEGTLDETKRRLEELSGLINTARISIDSLFRELLETTKDIKALTGQSSKDIPQLLEHTKRSLQDVEEILQSIKGIWPIRTGIKKEDVRPVEGDTHER